ncbi:MAG: hypothetical protein WBG28_07155 [Desulfobulbales bacterium]
MAFIFLSETTASICSPSGGNQNMEYGTPTHRLTQQKDGTNIS